MSEAPTFHFIDLLGLHLRARLDLPETRGLLPMVQWLSGLRIPALMLFPPFLVEALREELHRQHPWLREVQLPRSAFSAKGLDWAVFWAWTDVVQLRTCAAQGVEPDGFVLTQIDQSALPAAMVFIVIEPDEG